MANLDDLDMTILSALYSDANLSAREFSRRFGISSSLFYNRVNRLRKTGVIDKFTIEVNEEPLGNKTGATAGLDIDPKQRGSVLAELEKLEGVRLVREVVGRFDVIVDLKGASINDLHRMIQTIGELTGVTHAEVFVEVSHVTPYVNFRLDGGAKAPPNTSRKKLEAVPQIRHVVCRTEGKPFS